MRIAILNWSNRRVGGIETYLNALIPELLAAGNDVALGFEVDEPLEREPIARAAAVESWCVSRLGATKVLQTLKNWQPDVLYTHKLNSTDLEAETIDVAPAVFFAHDYQGMCISGTKTHQFPVTQPCHRRLGAACLAHYFPHRCGGLNPVTMMQLYRSQSKRRSLLRRYHAVVTHSDHMRSELIRNGVSPQCAFSFPFLVESLRSQKIETVKRDKDYVQLVFSGRMEQLKGGHVLLDALPEVQKALGRKVRLIFAGEGRKRNDWERQAGKLQRQHSQLEIEFVGWLDQARLDRLLDESDLLVVPSLWPEPFGLVGPEAGLRGAPAAAFAVGGISNWLEDGVNGHLAPGDPPTTGGLAAAIIRCLHNAETYEHLRTGATRLARRFNVETHLTNLMKVFNGVVAQPGDQPAARRM